MRAELCQLNAGWQRFLIIERSVFPGIVNRTQSNCFSIELNRTLVLKINNKVLEARVTSVLHVFFLTAQFPERNGFRCAVGC